MEALLNFFSSFYFTSPFIAFGILPVFLFFLWFALKRKKAEKHSHLAFWGREKVLKRILQKLFFILPFLLLFSILIAIAGPQRVEELEKPLEARDIVMLLDVSGSMMISFYPEAEDPLPNFEKTRLGVAEKTLREFVRMRQGDRMAVILYDDPGRYVARGFTDDQDQLLSVFNKKEIEGIYEYLSDSMDRFAIHRGTNTAMGLELAQEFIEKESKATERLIVLVSDLDDELDEVSGALREVKEKGIKVYVIGIVGGESPQKVETKKRILEDDSFRFFWVQEQEGLLSAFRAIDRMEKSVVEIKTIVALNSVSWIFIISALCFTLIFVAVGERFKRIP